jgi:hypothetical protein
VTIGERLATVPRERRPLLGCKRPYRDVRLAPKLRDATGARVVEKRETLCTDCFRERTQAKGVRITLADLVPSVSVRA